MEVIDWAPQAAVADLSAPDTTVFTGDELVRRGYRTLGDALAYELGVLRSRDGRGIGTTVLGVPAGFVLIVDGIPRLVDGERSVLDVFDMLALHDVERVEIVRGPATALSGAGALTGVVRVARKKPGITGVALRGGGTVFLDPVNGGSAIGGGEKELVGEGTVRTGDLGARAFVRVRSGPPFLWRVHNAPTRFERIGTVTLPVSATTTTVSPGDDGALLARGTAQWGAVVADVSWGRTVTHAPLSSFSAGFVADTPERATREQVRAQLAVDRFLGPLHVEGTVGVGQHGNEVVIPLFPRRGAFLAGGELQLLSVARFANGALRLGLPITPGHRVLGGVVGDFTQLTQRSSSTDPRTGAPSPSESALVDNAGGASAGLEYQGDFPLGLHATAGLALEWRDAFPVVLAPRLGLAWDALDDVRFRASYSEGVRAPDRFDLFALGAAVVDGRVVGVADNDLLQPEHVRMLDVGVGLQPSADLRFTSRAFALRHESALSTESTGGVLRPVNLDPRVVIGGEVGAGVAPLPSSVRGLLRLDGGVAIARTIDGPDLAADQLHATLQSSSSPMAGLVVGLRGRAHALLGAAAVSPSGAVLDTFASYDPSGSLSLTLSCANILDANERTTSTLAQPFSPPATYPGPGRILSLSVEGRH